MGAFSSAPCRLRDAQRKGPRPLAAAERHSAAPTSRRGPCGPGEARADSDGRRGPGPVKQAYFFVPVAAFGEEVEHLPLLPHEPQSPPPLQPDSFTFDSVFSAAANSGVPVVADRSLVFFT